MCGSASGRQSVVNAEDAVASDNGATATGKNKPQVITSRVQTDVLHLPTTLTNTSGLQYTSRVQTDVLHLPTTSRVQTDVLHYQPLVEYKLMFCTYQPH